MAGLVVACVVVAAPAPAAQPTTARAAPELRESIRLQLESASDPAGISVLGEPIRAATATPSFYELRGYRPAWLLQERPVPAARDLVRAIRESEREGLVPREYHLELLTRLLSSTAPRGDAADLERLAALVVLLTDAFLVFAAHLVNGRFDPVTFDPEWIAVRRELDLIDLLNLALDSGDPHSALDSLRPRHDEGYHRLVEALGRHREIEAAGGWSRIPAGPVLKPGETDERTTLLRGDPAWSPESLRRALDSGRERTIMLPKPLPVHLLYWTAFVGAGDTIQFRRDIYGRDLKLEQALEALSAEAGP